MSILTGYQPAHVRSVVPARITMTLGPFFVTRRMYEVKGQVAKMRGMLSRFVGSTTPYSMLKAGGITRGFTDLTHKRQRRGTMKNG